MVEAAHSKLSPSGAERWMACPASIGMSAGIKDKSSIHAAEGTVAHDLAFKFVTGEVNYRWMELQVGTIVKQDGFDITISDEMVDGAVEYEEMIAEQRMRLEAVPNRPIIEKAEHKVCASSVDPELWGTADFIMYQTGETLFVDDYKFGKGKIVEPEENEQLGIYAIAAMDSTWAGWEFKKVILTIHQPRAPHADGPVREWEASMEWLRALQARLIKGIAATKDPKAKPVAGNHCHWCPARPRCPEMSNYAQKAAAVDFKIVPSPAASTPAAMLPTVRLMDNAGLGRALAYKGLLDSWFKSIGAVIEEELEAGRAVPGFKLVAGKSNRVWPDEKAVIDHFEPIVGKEKLYTKPKLIGPAKLEKIVGKKTLDATGLWEKPPASKSVAPDSDPRPAVDKSSAAEDFAPVVKAPAKTLEQEILGS